VDRDISGNVSYERHKAASSARARGIALIFGARIAITPAITTRGVTRAAIARIEKPSVLSKTRAAYQ